METKKYCDEKREVLKNLQQNWDKIFQVITGNTKLYYINNRYITRPKCDVCDENREITVDLPDGSKRKIPCSCNQLDDVYEVKDATDSLKVMISRDGALYFGFGKEYVNQESFYKIVSLKEAKESIAKNKFKYSSMLFTKESDAKKICEILSKKEHNKG